MKRIDVEERVIEIRKHRRDPETWHGMRDKLYLDILEAAATGQRNIRPMVQAALVLQHPNEQPAWEGYA